MTVYKPYNYALGVTSQFYFCGLPFRLDVTPGCVLNCSYCFAKLRGGKRGGASQVASVKYIRNKFRRVLESNVVVDLVDEFIMRRVPLHFGGMSDPFSSDLTSPLAYDIIEMLSYYSYPTVISTKNTGRLFDGKVLSFLSGKNFVVQVSVCSANNSFSKIVEPNAPSVCERIEAIARLSELEVYTMCRLQPLFIGQIDRAVSELVPMLGKVGCKHVLVEFLKLPTENVEKTIGSMLNRLCWDAYGEYKALGARRVGREYVLPAEVKYDLLRVLVRAIRDNGMTYGAADSGLHHRGDTLCCCGVDHVPGFERWIRGNIACAVSSPENGLISFEGIRKSWLPSKSVKKVVNSKSRIVSDDQSMLSYLRQKWNSFSLADSPSVYHGVVYSGFNDENDDKIYTVVGG